jgi:glucose-6-phosphate isomerase
MPGHAALLDRADPRVREGAAQALRLLKERKIAARMWARDHTVWRADPAEIRDRLGWLDLPRTMAPRIPELRRIAEEVQERADDVVLLGMGGSSLAPEVFAQSFGPRPGFPRLHVLDSTSPRRIRSVGESVNWKRLHVLAASKSGSTIEVRTLFAHFFEGLRARGIEPGACFTAITDPGTSLAELGASRRFSRVLLNPPDLGGRYSALSLFGLLPAALLGIDLDRLLQSAAAMARSCEPDVPAEENPGLVLGALLGSAAHAGRDKLTLRIAPPLESFALWIEQLVAESTGKDGVGIVPVAGEPRVDPSLYGADRLFVAITPGSDLQGVEDAAALQAAGHPLVHLPAGGAEDLGAEMFRWEFATAVAGHLLGIHPFDQPNVEAAKRYARDLFEALKGGENLERISERDPVSFLASAHSGDHVGIMVYGDPDAQLLSALQELRAAILEQTRAATTLGIGPRFLHSTGQLHKGGSPQARYLQMVLPENPLPIPGEGVGFDQLLFAQAAGDYRALAESKKPVARAPAAGDPAEAVREWAMRLGGAKG